MAKTIERHRAIELRRDGKSYNQIRAILQVSKGTLSYWLKDYPLSQDRIRELRDFNSRRIESYRETRRKQREARLQKVYEEQQKVILPLLKNELFLAGLFLYWGEGSKTRLGGLAMTNTDPAIARFFIKWLDENFGVKKERLKVALHLYQDMDIAKETDFWSKTIDIPKEKFLKPYIKKSKSTDINRKGGFGHGTCRVTIDKTRLAEKVILGVKVIRDYFGS